MGKINISDALSHDYDTCVIGAGAAGLALAISLGQAGQRVLVIERGGYDQGDIEPSDALFDISSPLAHDPRQKTNREAVGGTLHGWGGRCMPFDPEDFDPKPDAPMLGWPIPYEEYEKWIAPAASFLETDPQFSEPPPQAWENIQGLRADRVERLNASRQVNALQAWLQGEHTPFDLLENTDLIRMTWAVPHGTRQVAAMVLEHNGARFSLPCRQIVLACGGLETARQLLLAQALRPDLLGGSAGPLGRYYMGHLTGSVATITFANADLANGFAYARTPEHSSPYRRRLTLTEGAPANTAFWIENIDADNPLHQSGEISFKHLATRGIHASQSKDHIANVLRDPKGIVDALRSGTSRRSQGNKRHPQRLITHRGPSYALAYHSEHFPLYDSHVRLSDATDAKGRQKLIVDFQYGEETLQALAENHLLLARRLKDVGLAQLDLPPTDSLQDAIRSQARDGYHQAGLARMSAFPKDGVVDPNCRVHGTSNLFVASAAVFPVSGQANPTLSVVALALRLAHELVSKSQAVD